VIGVCIGGQDRGLIGDKSRVDPGACVSSGNYACDRARTPETVSVSHARRRLSPTVANRRLVRGSRVERYQTIG
jgi:hypothetical protein